MYQEFRDETKGPYRVMTNRHYERPTPTDPAKIGLVIAVLIVTVLMYGPAFRPVPQNQFVGTGPAWLMTDDRWLDVWPYVPPMELFESSIVIVVIETNTSLDICVEDRANRWRLILRLRCDVIFPHGFACGCGSTQLDEPPRKHLQHQLPRRRLRHDHPHGNVRHN